MRNITLFINENYVFMSIENAYLIEIFYDWKHRSLDVFN